MKKLLVFMCAFFLFLPTASAADGKIQGESFYNGLVSDITSGKLDLSPVSVINAIIDSIGGETRELKSFIKTVLITGVFAGILKVISDSLGSNQASGAGFFACFSIMTVTALEVFTKVVGYGTEVIRGLCEFITKLEPVFIGLLVSAGAITQAAAFGPVITASVYVISVVIENCILPLTYFSAMLAIVNNMSGRIEFGTLNKMIQSVSRWILVAILTVFSAILTFYGFTASSLNTVATKGIKFAVGSLVPVVGTLLSDTVETVLSGAGLIKNAAGTAGMITVIAIAAVPIIKIWVMMMVLKLTASFLEPFSDKKITNMLLSMSDAVTCIFAMVITAMVLFLISIGIILSATGVSM